MCEYGFHDRFYKINGEDYLEKYGLRTMFLQDVEFDKKYESPKSLFMKYVPETQEFGGYYESELGSELEVAHGKFHFLKYIHENVNKEDPRYKSYHLYKVLKYNLLEHDLIHKL